ncbi:hypothetical protein BUALT_Bualt13G0102400 [Buddleja alternifolia]|uniref:Uncharacterized protein n=1 Tax=Buddleja alternifolia TaxID=168488 RepID=A0AAV6WT00_9LAMI|nr:hypothetical protein BUALT_Bualt13G0102400 [Buddleja alternifolia]
MGDRATLEKARKELEELYMGVPDDSVNLTFQDLAEIRQHDGEKKKTSSTMEAISESSPRKASSPFARLPSVDFNKALEASYGHDHHHDVNIHNDHHRLDEGDLRGPRGGHMYVHDHHHNHNHHNGGLHSGNHGAGFRHSDQRSFAYDDMSHVSGMSVAYGQERGGGRRRPGIPHSKICTVCCNYIYIFRHRCLVCGRVYCRQCVSVGMGEMTEGRKCIECLGRKFSQRYIKKAGSVGCCMGYPSTVKQQELKWAERGPRRSGENAYGHSVMVSRTRSPRTPTTPTRAHQHSPTNPPSFVASSPYSPYSQASYNHHPLPF